MSSATRAQRAGNKGAQQNTPNSKHNKNTDKHAGDTPKPQDKIQAKPTAEQMRIAQITDVHMEEPGIRDMVATIIEMTCRSEEEVCSALHDCDNDMDRAVNMLFESNSQSGWETSVKKKKNRVGSTGGGGTTGEGEDWDTPGSTAGPTEPQRGRPRGGAGGPRGPRRGNLDSRGWRGREQRENERNLEDGAPRVDGGYRRGGGRSMNGPGGRGGGYGGRGGRGGGRLGGPRNYQSRGEYQPRGPRHVETSESWDEPQTNTFNNHNQPDNWGEKFPSPEDWDNEEYTGSLADTKVFTPSGNIEPIQTNMSLADQSIQDSMIQDQDIIQQYTATVVTSTNLSNLSEVGRNDQSLTPPQLHPDTTSNIPGFASPKNPAVITPTNNMSISGQQNPQGVNTLSLSQPPPLPEVHPAPTAAQQLTQALELHASTTVTQNSGSLSAEQSQYFSTLSQQSNDLKNVSYGAHPGAQAVNAGTPYSNSVNAVYTTQGYGNGGNYVVTGREPVVSAAPQPQRKQRARVPPPSKIPATAVEMPGDVSSSSVGYLDVQFGALEFGSDTSSFDGNAETKYEATTAPQAPIEIAQTLDGYKTNTSINTSLGPNQMLSSTDALSQQNNEHNLSSVSVQSYSSQSRSGSAAPPAVVSVTNTPSSANTSIDQLSKSDNHSGYGPASGNSVSQYQQNNYSKPQSAYQSPAPYSNNYSNTQVTTTYPQQSTVNSYSNASSAYNNSGNVNAVYQPNNSNYSSQSVQSVSGYPTHSQGFSSITQPSAAFPTQSQGSYQSSNAQSVYGAGAGLNANYAGSNNANSSVTGNQYNNYSASVATTHTHKLPNKEPQYESPASTAVSLTTTSSSVNSPALGLTAQPSATVAKTTNSSGVSNKNVVNTTGAANSAGMAGVAPVMGQYIMGQPYYQHPLYSYEELQLLQQRIPHMTTGYYDMGYQAPTTLGTGRDGTLGSVAYSMSDGRFTRADNNASPVPSTMSQQTASGAGHAGAPMLNHTLPPGYAYFYGGGAMMPGSFQYGTPAIYPQMTATANAHGSTNTSQYPKPSYSGYGSGYDSLSQTQDYSKPSGYPGAVSAGVGGTQGGPQTGNKGGTGATTQGAGPGGANTDLSSAMYGKSHAALNKVNSYEKQGFHSGTPPPFNLTGTGNSGLAPSGTYGTPHLFIPTMAPQHQHHNTQLLHQPLHQVRHAEW